MFMDEERKVYVLSLAVMTIVFVLVSVYAFSANVNGDAFTHAIFGQTIAEEGDLLNSYPYRVMNITEGEIIFSPIPYSELFHVTLAEMYLYSDLDAFRILSPFLAAMTALAVFLMLRRFNLALAFFTPILMTLICIHRLAMVPLMEQTMLFAIFVSLLVYWKFYRTRRMRYAVLTGIFLGAAIATKQTGMLAAAAIVGHFLLVSLYTWFKQWRSGQSIWRVPKYVVSFLICIIMCLAVAMVPLADQYERNGTLGYSPGQTTVPDFIPFSGEINSWLKGKYPSDPEAVEEMRNYIGYFVTNLTVEDTAEQYLTFPQMFTNSMKDQPFGSNIWIVPDLILLILGVVYLWGRSRFLTSALLVLATEEFVTTYLFSQRVEQYHIIGLAVFSIFFVAGILQMILHIKGWLRNPVTRKVLVASFLMLILVSTSVGYIDIVHKNLYGADGRQSDSEMYDFNELGYYVLNNTPEEALFISPWGNFNYYSHRDCVWINEGGNAYIPDLLKTTNESLAISYLREYNITYIVVNKRQFSRQGVIDYFPDHGLMDYIDESENFCKEFTSTSEEVMLYRFKG